MAWLTALAVYRDLKIVILVDEDVDLFGTNDVLWAMQARYQGDIDTMFLQGVTGHVCIRSPTSARASRAARSARSAC